MDGMLTPAECDPRRKHPGAEDTEDVKDVLEIILRWSCLVFSWWSGGRILQPSDAQRGPKNWHIFVRLITSLNINQFSNFFSLSESRENS